MEIGSAITVIGSIASAIQDVKTIINTIPITFLPSNKDTLNKAQTKLDSIDERLKLEFPKLASLIRTYSETLSKTRVAKATSDKISEIIGVVDFATAIPTFISFTESEFSGISSSVEELPPLDISERGALDEKLRNIDRCIQRLKELSLRSDGKTEISSFRENFSRISTEYADMERILKRFLNKVLDSFDLAKK